MSNTKTYKITRFYRDSNIEKQTIMAGLTLKEAQEHCSKDYTQLAGQWFDGYQKEEKNHES